MIIFVTFCLFLSVLVTPSAQVERINVSCMIFCFNTDDPSLEMFSSATMSSYGCFCLRALLNLYFSCKEDFLIAFLGLPTAAGNPQRALCSLLPVNQFVSLASVCPLMGTGNSCGTPCLATCVKQKKHQPGM